MTPHSPSEHRSTLSPRPPTPRPPTLTRCSSSWSARTSGCCRSSSTRSSPRTSPRETGAAPAGRRGDRDHPGSTGRGRRRRRSPRRGPGPGRHPVPGPAPTMPPGNAARLDSIHRPRIRPGGQTGDRADRRQGGDRDRPNGLTESDGPTLVTTMIDPSGCPDSAARQTHPRRLRGAPPPVTGSSRHEPSQGPDLNFLSRGRAGCPCPTGVSASPVDTPPSAGLAADVPPHCRRLRPDKPGKAIVAARP